MAYPKFHGITLASGATIENLNIERLAADPVPVVPARMWFNTTEKALKFSSLDSGGAIVVEVVSTAAALSAALSQISALDTRVSDIEGTYIKKDGSVAFTGPVSMGQHVISDVATPVAGSDAANKDYVQALVSNLGNAFNYVGTVEGGADAGSATDLSTLPEKDAGDYYKVSTAGFFKLGADTFHANVGDGLVFNTMGGVDKIDNTDAEVSGTDGYITVTGSVDTGFTVDIDATFKGRVSDLETGLANEITRATGVEDGLGDRLTTAEGTLSTLQGTVGGLASDLEDEVTRATGVEQGLDSRLSTAEGTIAQHTIDIGDEVTRATGAEEALGLKIGDLDELDTTDKTSLVNAMNEIVALAGEGTDALKAEINAQRFTFQAQAAALTHVVEHNLNTGFPSVDTRVRGDDGVYRNDIVAFEETDANTITVYLTEARIIKVSVQAMDQMA